MRDGVLGDMKRRVANLESQAGPDPLEVAFDTLTDDELDILSEYMGLARAGFSSEEIEDMMQEKYVQALAIVDSVNVELAKLDGRLYS